MRNNKIKGGVCARLLAILAAVALLTGCNPASAPSQPLLPQTPLTVDTVTYTEEEGTLSFANDTLSVKVNTENGDFSVTVLATGQVFLSNPDDRDAEGSGRGVQKMKLYSQLLVSFLDNITGTPTSKISYTGSVTKDGFSIEKRDGGVRLNYHFPEENITVPLELTLCDGVLSARVDVESVKNSENYSLYAFSMLPYFGSGNGQTEGYLFIPDGSGALVDFQTDRSNAQPYNQPIYGLEPSYVGDLHPGSTEKVLLPIYGIGKPEGAFLAEITSGVGVASLEAYASGMINHHNTVYPSFQVIGSGTVTIGESNQGAVKEAVLNHDSRLLSEARVDFRFLTEDTSYVGMAKAYREMLKSRGVGATSGQSTPLYTEFVGGVLKKESVFGFLVDRSRPLTTVEQAQGAVNDLKQMTEDLSLIYTNWSKDGITGKLPVKAKPEGVVGTAKEFNALASAVDGRLALAYEPLLLQKGGNGFNTYADTAKRIGGEAVRLWQYRLSTEYKDNEQRAAYYVKTGVLKDSFDSYLADQSKRLGGTSLYSETLGNLSYTDFSDDIVVRDQAIADITAVLAAGGKWILKQPAAYALPYTAAVVDAPIVSSGFDLFTEDVPFYQLCLNGLVDMTTACVNAQDNPRIAVLNAVETGSALFFRLFCEDAVSLQDTAQNTLFYGSYGAWKEDISSLYALWKTAQADIGDATVVSRECVMDDVYKTTFSNGKAVYVNYGENTYQADGVTVSAYSFSVGVS